MFRLTRALVLARRDRLLSMSAIPLEKSRNHIQLMGADPKGYDWKKGKVVTFYISTTTKKELTQWHIIVVYDKSTQNYAPVCHQGRLRILLDGTIEYVQDGTTKHYTNIILEDMIQTEREEQPAIDSNDAGVDEDSVGFKSGSLYNK